jgi:hypothetical protein
VSDEERRPNRVLSTRPMVGAVVLTGGADAAHQLLTCGAAQPPVAAIVQALAGLDAAGLQQPAAMTRRDSESGGEFAGRRGHGSVSVPPIIDSRGRGIHLGLASLVSPWSQGRFQERITPGLPTGGRTFAAAFQPAARPIASTAGQAVPAPASAGLAASPGATGQGAMSTLCRKAARRRCRAGRQQFGAHLIERVPPVAGEAPIARAARFVHLPYVGKRRVVRARCEALRAKWDQADSDQSWRHEIGC